MDAGSIRHDATSGFHDIKALGDSSFQNPSLFDRTTLLLGLAFLLLLLLALSFLRRKSFRPKKSDSAFSLFRAEVTKLKNDYERKSLSSREAASQCSGALRDLLETTLRFPARELTAREIGLRLEDVLSSRFSSEETSRIVEFQRECRELLRSLERGAYGTSSVVNEEGQKLLPAIEKAQSLVQQLEQWIDSPTPKPVENTHAPL